MANLDKVSHFEFGVFWQSDTTSAWGEYKSDSGYPWITKGLGNGPYSLRYESRAKAVAAIIDINRMFSNDSRMQGITLVVGVIDTNIIFEHIDDKEILEARYEKAINKLQPDELNDIIAYIKNTKQ